MKKEIKKRYIVTTIGNCFLHGFEKWDDTVNYCNQLDITVKVYDRTTDTTWICAIKEEEACTITSNAT